MLLLLCLFSGTVLGESLDAELDHREVESGQSVSLTVTARGVDGEIDLSVLEADFDILDTSRSKSVQIVNGKTDSSLSWRIGLMPKRTGTLQIPAFSLGSIQSRPIELLVKAVDPQSAGREGREYFVELEVDNTEPFVQQQVLLTVRVYMATSIIEGSLSGPQVKQALVERLGNDRNYTKILDERQYQVTERRYALFAQQSGPLEIPPLQLEATIRDQNRGSSPRGFFTPTRKLRLGSNTVTLNVRPKPVASASTWWLPAETLSLTADWNGDISTARVDEPIIRSISLSVRGLHSTQLPTLLPPELANAKVYPDQANVDNQILGDAIVSYRTDNWAIIPRQAGPLTLPEISIEWYDTINDEIRQATIPAETIEVLPASATADQAADPAAAAPAVVPEPVKIEPSVIPATPATTESPADKTVPAEGQPGFSWWPWIAGLAVAGWLLTLVLWRLSARGKSLGLPTPVPVKTKNSRLVNLGPVERACARRDPQAISQAVLQWAAEQWPENPPRNLTGLAEKLRSPEIKAVFARIDAALYSPKPQTIDCVNLVAQMRAAVTRLNEGDTTRQTEALLPQL